MDLWITRHNYRAPRPYWGFWQFNSSNGESLAESADAEEAVATVGAVLFLGGNATASKFVNDRWPRLTNRSFQVRGMILTGAASWHHFACCSLTGDSLHSFGNADQVHCGRFIPSTPDLNCAALPDRAYGGC